jgi:uncharacterized SAM-binding protein YcdF (DUF218 family)
VALVFGAAVRAGGTPSAALERRARCAAALWHAGEVRAIVLSGGVRTHPPAEADVMARVCLAEGVSRGALVLERAALTTEENVLFARPLLEDLGAQEIVLVTDGYHMARAVLVARRAGWRARGVSPALTGAPMWRVARAWMREAVAFGWYWLRGAGR